MAGDGVKTVHNRIKARLKEPSTWNSVGIAALIAVFGTSPVAASAVVNAIQSHDWTSMLGVGLPIVLGAVLPERGGK